MKIRFAPIFGLFCLLVWSLSCKKGDSDSSTGFQDVEEPTLKADNPVMQLLAPEETGIAFQNLIIETYEDNITTNINKYNGGGMAVGDINNDQLPDLFFIGCNGKNGLFLNEGNLKFKDITEAAGVVGEDGFETSATMVDVNADGWLDIYVCRGGVEINDTRRNKLYINNKNLTFTEKSREYGLDDKSATTGANFFDADNDGDLDCYVLNYPTEDIHTSKIEAKLAEDGKTYIPQIFPKKEFDSDRFYRNDNGKFIDVSQKSGVWNLGYGLSVSVSDFNQDGYTDVYVGNDFIQPDQLYINNKNGTFTNKLADYFKHTTQHTMGTDITDFNNDGYVDMFGVDMLSATNFRRKSYLATNTQARYSSIVQNGYFEPIVRNVLQRNNGNGTFSDVGCMAGVFQTDWSWSGLLFDMDNDGLRDLHVTNGYRREVTNRDFIEFTLPAISAERGKGRRLRDIYPNFQEFLDIIPIYKLRNFGFANKGDMKFEDVSGKWMTMPASWSCGSVWSDLDLDGDLELIVNNLEQPAFIYKNLSREQNKGAYLQIKLAGDAPNYFAVGASVLIEYDGGKIQYQENFPTRGIFSSVEHLIHFGLGQSSTIDKVTVRWPNGKTQTLTQVPVNQRLTLKQSDASGYTTHLSPSLPKAQYFDDVTAQSGVNFLHEEEEFNDFEQYPLNLWKTTDLGPVMASGDVNGDGLDDFFIGNSFDKPAALWIQKSNGTFQASSTLVWGADKIFEDHGACFFDADRDGDLDLFVVSGGMEATSPMAWQNRLYINTDGKGNFAGAPNAIPRTPDVGLRSVAHDFDGDGDLDLFVGGRVTPAKWPMTPRSVVLRNEGNRFADVTAQVAPDFERCGMVTDLQWANIDGDPAPELVVCGEWMPLMVFKVSGGNLVNATESFGLNKSNGIWWRMALSDLDQDGDLDIVTGNLGLNTRLPATDDKPLRCFAADFDKNGTIDPIVAHYEGDKLYPLVQKEVLNKQMPLLKKKFLKAKDYSVAVMSDVYPQKDLDAALNLYAYTLATCWWENKDGKFVRHELPNEAQISVVQGIVADDFNRDGLIDLLLAGNKYGLEVETGRCDAGAGCLLLGDGKGHFTPVNNVVSGFRAPREARDLVSLKAGNGRKIIVVSNNNDKPQVFRSK